MPRFNYTCAITKALTIYTEMKKLNPSTVYNEMTIRESAPYRLSDRMRSGESNETTEMHSRRKRTIRRTDGGLRAP